MRQLCVTVIALCLTAVHSAHADELCGTPSAAPAAVLARVSAANPPSAVTHTGQYLAIFDQASKIMWTFTADGHAAHPSVVCRRIVQEAGGSLSLLMNVHCVAAEAACLQLKRDFEALNARMIDELKKKQGR